MAAEEDQTAAEVDDADGHGGNNDTCPSPPATVPQDDLDDEFQGAMYVLQQEREQATVVDTDGNEALIWLGEYDLHEYSERWDDPSAELYILVDQSFAGSDPHWVMMAPAVTVDGNEPGDIPCRNVYPYRNGSHQDKVDWVTEVAGADSAMAFSWRWSKMDRQPENARDLADAHGLVEYLLRVDEPEGSA